MKEQNGVETAQTQLGHFNLRVTEADYIQRMNSAPDLTLLLNMLGPVQVNTSTPEIDQNVD
ncbi:hypothetical protein GCM10007304_45250 [Rhodococcoides trifolii]|uniref:Uncharacterized protein n=1 Tax=Rhodococcoides trifolii TaxID=908250 RepID=A0A917G713_9NOCA|nr:hypothetical protein [Rhodococcus trifolii]GGG26372.1 hypothetical protein GCM10007304_45250 [Rhodococcus trifolii]